MGRRVRAAQFRTVNEQLFDDAIIHAIRLERFKAGEVREIVAMLKNEIMPSIAARLESRIARIASRGFDSGVFTTNRYKEMIRSINAVIEKGYGGISNTIVNDMVELARLETEVVLTSLSRAMPIAISYSTPSSAVLKALVTNKPMGNVGVTMKEALSGLSKGAKTIVTQQIRVGIGSGESLSQIVRRVRGATGAEQLLKRQATAIVRTSIAHTSNAAREETFAANSDVIGKLQYVATLDSRTTDICASLDGEVFGLYEGPRPPMHHQCRSNMVPVTKSWSELGIPGLKELPPTTRAALGGPVSEKTGYGDWIQRQPIKIQNEALGVGRAQLLRSGRVSISQFTDSQYRPLSLKQLTALANS